LPSPYQPARARAGRLSAGVGHLSGYQRVVVPDGILEEAPAARGQVRRPIGDADRQRVQVDDVDVRLLARRQRAAILKALAARGAAGLHPHRPFRARAAIRRCDA
jgi:hypothetical protein